MQRPMNFKGCNVIPFTDDQLRRMVTLYAQGWSSRQLSLIYGISPNAILRRLHALNASVRPAGEPKGHRKFSRSIK